jgi:hypothetical protein
MMKNERQLNQLHRTNKELKKEYAKTVARWKGARWLAKSVLVTLE